MTGDTALEQWDAFLNATTIEQAARDRETGLSEVEARMLAAIRRRNT